MIIEIGCPARIALTKARYIGLARWLRGFLSNRPSVSPCMNPWCHGWHLKLCRYVEWGRYSIEIDSEAERRMKHRPRPWDHSGIAVPPVLTRLPVTRIPRGA